VGSTIYATRSTHTTQRQQDG